MKLTYATILQWNFGIPIAGSLVIRHVRFAPDLKLNFLNVCTWTYLEFWDPN